MRIVCLLLALSVGSACSKKVEPVNEKAVEHAAMILHKMDKALGSHNYTEFLKMHADTFHFKFCENTGTTSQDLEKLFKTDQFLSQTVKSKHTIRPSGTGLAFTKVTINQYKFAYEEHLLLKNTDVYRSEGVINFLDLGTHVQIISAEEKCPVKIF